MEVLGWLSKNQRQNSAESALSPQKAGLSKELVTLIAKAS